MRYWIAFWNIVLKDMRAYYIKPPNISWGIIFPIAWTGMFFIKSGGGLEQILPLLPGLIGISILFGTTSMLAVTVTFEKKARSFERLLLAPIPLELLMLAKTGGAILFGITNAFVPVAVAAFIVDLSQAQWLAVLPAVAMIAIVSTFLGLFIAVSVSEIFEALPTFLRPLSYILPLTYGVDILHGAMRQNNIMPISVDFGVIGMFCIVLFLLSVRNIQKKWIV
jgi:ABC-2 type transport system permease protein